MTNSYPQKVPEEQVEDCRDFLRTGRCKYGASCKFNHPPNVQSGGGMKAPIDPSEPLFPIRPKEPVCQYYMKHGTCKFGQSCKFHHPPQSSMGSPNMMGANAIFIPRQGNDGSSLPQHIHLNAGGSENQPSTMMLQFLPQRPDEPDCIYFLRNGTCKYGATCRYHHPVNTYQERKATETKRRQQPQQVVQLARHVSSDGTVQYVKAQQSLPHQGGRVVSTSNGGHVLVTETPIHLLPVANGGYAQMSFSSSDNGNDCYQQQQGGSSAVMSGVSQDHASSSSLASLASSYETTNSSLEYISQAQGNWNRQPKRSSSVGSLNGFNEVQPNRQHGNTRRFRASSFGSVSSVSEPSIGYHENVMGYNSGNVQLPVHQEQGNGEVEYDRSFFAEYRANEATQQRQPEEQIRAMKARGQTSRQQSQSGDVVDHGLSMMTSALLNMLDTPDDALHKIYPPNVSPTASSNRNNSPSPPLTPKSGNMQTLQGSTTYHEQQTPHTGIHRVRNNIPEARPQLVYDTQSLSESSSPEQYLSSSQYFPAQPLSTLVHSRSSKMLHNGELPSKSHLFSTSWQDPSLSHVDQGAGSKSLHHHESDQPPTHQTNIGLYLS
mmetsp:Transcript_15718/g.23132  ORF Transcript_15718/g.23132 Transcript_15718/m.23132 type:complete len:604 (-) Transcript_15718:236-2047(-)|eukprot:CAMPEP_0194204988 /NCGR_PEP_ID=MMETSP0156-20130528/4357_1 /TAXON_ID=33649 /ORGANISM="Thalassionema nitzschioides, Strain L26-B" /LENGTH=603 /DNA_ID=CAMNT_0038931135 /DNA_START=722 /DNA_END=2533 /DNA_ORIENTATION=-